MRGGLHPPKVDVFYFFISSICDSVVFITISMVMAGKDSLGTKPLRTIPNVAAIIDTAALAMPGQVP